MAPKAPTLPSAEEIGKLVPIGRIAKDTPYSADFLRQLARSGKIRAFKLNRDWLTTPNAIRDYLKTQTKRHEKALSLLQSAEKAFLALTLLLIVFSATPKARAEGLANPPPHESTMSAILHKLTSSFFGKPNDSVTTITYPNPRLVSISSEDVGTGNVFSSKFSISATLHDLKTSWHNFDSFYGQELSAVGTRLNTALLTLGQALLGKTTEEYLADAPARIFALAKHPIEPRGPEMPNSATSATPHVLGDSTVTPTPQGETLAANNTAAMSATQITALVQQFLARYIAQAQQGPVRPQGPPGPPGHSGLTPGFSGPNGMVQNDNGKTTSVIGGTPIVSYIPATPSQSFNGGSLAGFTQLSANSLTAQSATIQGALTVQGSATISGSQSVLGNFTAATSTLSTLTVSGPVTLSGSTTIAGLTVTGLNPGLTLGSVTFQGAAGLSQDNANFFYDSINHRLGLGTTTPGQFLTVAGNALVTGNATTTGNQIVSGSFSVSGASTLATTTATNFTSTGPTALQSTLAVTGTSTLATSTITNLTVSQAPTISAFSTGIIHSNGSGLLSSSSVNLSTGDVSGILPAGNGGTGAATLSQYNLLAGNGSNAVATITPGTVFQVLRSAGAAAYPTYSDITSLLTAGSNITITGTSTIAVSASPTFTGTTSVATLTTAGRVGIGTTNPGNGGANAYLRVLGSGGEDLVIDDAGSPYVAFYNGTSRRGLLGYTGDTTNFDIINEQAGYIRLKNNGTEVMRVTSAGNLLLGNTSGSSLLSVGSSAQLTVTSSGNLTTTGTVSAPTYTASGPVAIKPGADSTTAIQLQTSGGTSVLNVDTTNSRVGIGTNSASAPFQVYASGLAAKVGGNAPNVSTFLQVTDNGTIISNFGVDNSGVGFLGTQTSHPMIFRTANSERMRIDSSGNIGIGTTTPTLGPLTMASGAYVSLGGTWTNASDRNLKENFATVSPASILEKIDQLPVTQWDYKSEGASVNHIGPVAQDFWAAFHLGNSSTSISTIDPAGVALLGIQALDQKITALQGAMNGNATTSGELSVYNPGNFSGDSVGEAEIIQSGTSVRVNFSQPYAYQPIITADVLDQFVQHYITDVNAAGFTIRTTLPVTSATTFTWHSFASPSAQLTVSGITQPIPLILPVVTATPPAPGSTAGSSASSTPDSTASSTPPAALGASTSTPSVAPSPALMPSQAQTVTITSASAPPAPTPRPVTSQSSSPAPSTPPPAPSETSSLGPAPDTLTATAPALGTGQ